MKKEKKLYSTKHKKKNVDVESCDWLTKIHQFNPNYGVRVNVITCSTL